MEPIEGTKRRSSNNGLRVCPLMALVLYALLPGDASAGDERQTPDVRRNMDGQNLARAQIGAPSFPAPFAFAVPRAEAQVFSPTEFRPRKPGAGVAAGGSEAAVIDAPMLRDTSIAEELSQAKTQDRVRLLTLWQNRASSLSLQTGKHGAPSLQWSTPWMHRDAGSRGLFDRLLAVSPHNFGSTLRGGSSHPAGATPAKPLDLTTSIDTK
jgi:hypothetical protein